MGDIAGATTILEFMKQKDMTVNENVFNSLITGLYPLVCLTLTTGFSKLCYVFTNSVEELVLSQLAPSRGTSR